MNEEKYRNIKSLLSRRNFSRAIGGGAFAGAFFPHAVLAGDKEKSSQLQSQKADSGKSAGNAESGNKTPPSQPVQPEGKIFCYVGCYTEDSPAGVEGNGKGIYLYEMNPESGELNLVTVFMGIASPSYLILSPNNDYLYAISEVNNYGSRGTGCVTGYSIDQRTGALTKLNVVTTGGSIPCYLSIHPSGKYLLIANYVGGSVAVVPIRSRGSLGNPTHVLRLSGPKRPDRAMDNPPGNYAISDHSGSHPHMIATSPGGKWILADDAGLDRLYIWRLDLARGKLIPGPVPFLNLEPGSAPRHFVFNHEGTMLYNLCEQDSKVVVSQFDEKSGRVVPIQIVSTLSAQFHGSTLAAEILLAPSGKFIYVSNRLGNSIAVFSVRSDGTLSLEDEIWSHADFGRAMMLDPTGAFLFSANQRSDSITSFRINRESGDIAFTHQFTAVGSPTVLAFMKGKP